jgi:hypothetical protein
MAPRQRAKVKAGNADDLDGETAQQLLQLLAEDSLGTDQVVWLAKADAPPCDGSCKINTKANPRCLCGLLPPPGSSRKKGLWVKDPTSLADIGPDPSTMRREVCAVLIWACMGSRRRSGFACTSTSLTRLWVRVWELWESRGASKGLVCLKTLTLASQQSGQWCLSTEGCMQ